MLSKSLAFVYWLQGILDTNKGGLSLETTKLIATKLDALFDHGDKKEQPKKEETKKWTPEEVKENIDAYNAIIPHLGYIGGNKPKGELMRC